jgi:hypothetical protein
MAISGFAGIFRSLATIAENAGKQNPAIWRAFGIVQAGISTGQGIAQAITLPFPANWAQAGAVTAAGVQDWRWWRRTLAWG